MAADQLRARGWPMPRRAFDAAPDVFVDEGRRRLPDPRFGPAYLASLVDRIHRREAGGRRPRGSSRPWRPARLVTVPRRRPPRSTPGEHPGGARRAYRDVPSEKRPAGSRMRPCSGPGGHRPSHRAERSGAGLRSTSTGRFNKLVLRGPVARRHAPPSPHPRDPGRGRAFPRTWPTSPSSKAPSILRPCPGRRPRACGSSSPPRASSTVSSRTSSSTNARAWRRRRSRRPGT